jgi:Na+/glutamate symporter
VQLIVVVVVVVVVVIILVVVILIVLLSVVVLVTNYLLPIYMFSVNCAGLCPPREGCTIYLYF